MRNMIQLYINSSIEQLDAEIERIIDLNLPKSAFKRVIPVNIKEDLRRQYIEFLEQQARAQEVAQNESENSRPVTSQVIKVNISSLRQAGYCICPEELAKACEILIRQQSEPVEVNNQDDMNVLMENIQSVGKNESIDSEFNCDHETTHSKSNDLSSDNNDVDKVSIASKKVYPAKSEVEEFSKKRNSDKSHQSRKTKRKYFTKYMSSEFSKDVLPVTMSMMDSKTQMLFKEKEYNDLVSEITGML